MADRKISDLTALTTPATGDLIPIVDISEAAAADKNKSITVGELLRGAPDGTGAAPGIAFESDPDSGIYSAGANQVAISTGGSQRLLVESTGLTVNGTTTLNGTTLSLGAEGGANGFINAPESIYFNIDSNNGETGKTFIFAHNATDNSGVELLRIQDDGKVGIGNSTPGSYYEQADDLVIGSTSNNGITIVSGTTSNGRIHFADGTTGNQAYRGFLVYDHNSDAMQLGAAGDVAIHIDSSRHVGINTATPGSDYVLDCAGAARFTGGNGYVSYGDNGYIRTDASNELRLQGGTSGITFWKSGLSSESARFDDSGRLLVGVNSYSISSSQRFEVKGGSALFYNDSDAVAPVYIKNDNADSGSGAFKPFMVMQDASANRGGLFLNDSDQVGFSGHGGVFILTGGNAPASECARFTSQGYFKASNSANYVGGGSTYHEFTQSVDTACLFVEASNGTYTYPGILYVNSIRSASTAFNFQRMTSGDFSDTEFYFRGDGNAYADNSWNGGGADYAEYFEWSDGNTSSEDRRGISVVLDGDKIREAVAGEEPIGVISGNPSVVGDADGDRWKGKYLRDDFGSYVWEDYEVVNDEGETVVQQRRKLNPDFDPDAEYVTRENRPEWDCVGLMGKLRIRKGQVTGARWIKMRDISDNVEEWLVR